MLHRIPEHKVISFTGLTPFVGNQQAAVESKRLLGVVTLINMMNTGPRKVRSRSQTWLTWTLAVCRSAKAGSSALAFCALLLLPGSCLATEPLMPAPLRSNVSFLEGSTIVGASDNHRVDLVIVEPKGRGPQGFRYQIVLDSAARGPESSLDLAANAAGLLVTARDVDGIGNDLDLIIKSAKSFTPIGIWINNHHGGFTKVDPSLYALSIWSESPQLLSLNTTDTLSGAILLWHQSYTQPLAQRISGELRNCHGAVERADVNLPSRLTTHRNQSRAPPQHSAENQN